MIIDKFKKKKYDALRSGVHQMCILDMANKIVCAVDDHDTFPAP